MYVLYRAVNTRLASISKYFWEQLFHTDLKTLVFSHGIKSMRKPRDLRHNLLIIYYIKITKLYLFNNK